MIQYQWNEYLGISIDSVNCFYIFRSSYDHEFIIYGCLKFPGFSKCQFQWNEYMWTPIDPIW